MGMPASLGKMWGHRSCGLKTGRLAPPASAEQPDKLFVRGAEQNKAKTMCAGCPVRTECLAEALDNQIEWGVWGGMTERERRALLRRRPNASWRSLLETARKDATVATRESVTA